MTSEYERGTAPFRLEWIPETTVGETPSDPEWRLFSDNVISAWDWEPDANTTRQDAAGEIEAQGFFNGSETHEATFEYDLQQWFIDNSDNTQDVHGDFLRPSSDNALRATHSVVSRSEYNSGGNDDAGYRTYRVGKGGHPSDSTIPFETEEGGPITVDPSYQFEKVRPYTIHQPASDTQLLVNSTSNADTSQSITIENEGATNTESLTLDGTNQQTTQASFSDIDAVELDAEAEGTVTVTSKSSTAVLMFIRGQSDYEQGEGDLGVPALGSGSHASAIGTQYISFNDDSLDIPGIASGDIEVVSGELSVDTGLADNSQSGATPRRNIHPEAFEYIFTVSMAGEHFHVDQAINYLKGDEGTLSWDAGPNFGIDAEVRLTSPGSYTKEANDGKLVADNEFETIGSLTITNTTI